LALFADAIHMLQDVIALGMAVIAFIVVKKPKDTKHTFGYKRAEVVSAFVNGLSLFLVSIYIFYEALIRYNSPLEVKSDLMFVVSLAGLIVNLFGLYLLHGIQKSNINTKGAFLHVLSDTLGSIGAIAASIIIYLTNLVIFDLIISIFITILILLSSVAITKQALNILMERTPNNLNIVEIENKLLQVTGVKNIHDTHAWTISADQYNFSCHVEITKESEPCHILNAVTNMLTKEFHIKHTTIQIEHENKFVECGSC
jgi:cobalt-zinc-cadmium efflux system protein